MGRYTGPRGWSCFEWIKCEFKFLKCRLCPSSWIVLPCLLVHLVSTSQSPHPTCLLPSTNCKKTMNLCQLRKFTPQGRKRPWFWGEKNKTKKKSPVRTLYTSCFLGLNGLLKDNLFPAPAQNIDLISFVYVWTILCVPHFCVKTQKDKTKTRDNKKHYRGFEKKRKKKQYVGGILITSFELPVLSCSQLLKITGFKKTILQCSSSRPV